MEKTFYTKPRIEVAHLNMGNIMAAWSGSENTQNAEERSDNVNFGSKENSWSFDSSDEEEEE